MKNSDDTIGNRTRGLPGCSVVSLQTGPYDLCLFSFATAVLNSKALGSGTIGSVVNISVCLTSLNLPLYRVSQEEYAKLRESVP